MKDYPKVIEKKLGRSNALGLYYPDSGKIEVDPRQDPFNYMRVCIHEYIHHIMPEWEEDKVDQVSTDLAGFLWTNSFRRVSL